MLNEQTVRCRSRETFGSPLESQSPGLAHPPRRVPSIVFVFMKPPIRRGGGVRNFIADVYAYPVNLPVSSNAMEDEPRCITARDK